jgi:peroxiredoxin
MSYIAELRILRKLNLLVVIMLGLVLFSSVVHADLAPPFTLTDIDGHTFSLSDFLFSARASVVILDFFFTKCEACIQEMEQLEIVCNQLGTNITMISIENSGQSDDSIRQFENTYGLTVTWVMSGDPSESVWDSYAMPIGHSWTSPQIYIIDKDGFIRYQHIGEATNASVLKGEIQVLLGDPVVDLNGDGRVGLDDLVILARAYGSRPGDPNWNPVADIDGNGMVGLLDLVILAQHYGQQYPPNPS